MTTNNDAFIRRNRVSLGFLRMVLFSQLMTIFNVNLLDIILIVMNEDFFRDRINQELENISFNNLTELGNKAIHLKLIIGHGWRNGKYEILRRDEAVLLSEQEARVYLENLIEKTDF
ncbi:MAG: hypothetical protein AAFV71_01890 [Cyanobacteria bacterium J06633_8]